MLNIKIEYNELEGLWQILVYLLWPHTKASVWQIVGRETTRDQAEDVMAALIQFKNQP